MERRAIERLIEVDNKIWSYYYEKEPVIYRHDKWRMRKNRKKIY